MPSDALTVPVERRIYLIRGEKVMFDHDLAELYGVDTGALNRAVKRNGDRFPGDFMFQLGGDEWERLRCQIGISNKGTEVSRSALRFQIWHLKQQTWRPAISAVRFYRTKRRDVVQCVAQRPRGASQYCHHAYIRAPARDASVQCRSRSQIERTGKEIRRTVQGCFRCDSRVNDSAGKTKTPDWVPFS